DVPPAIGERTRDRRGDRAGSRHVIRGPTSATPCPREREQLGEVADTRGIGRDVFGLEARYQRQLLARPRDRDVEPALTTRLSERPERPRGAAERHEHDIALLA